MADNAMISPDLSPDGSFGYQITIPVWSQLGEAERHLYVCLVMLHRVVRKIGKEGDNRLTFHRHQACAARQLQRLISNASNTEPNPSIAEVASMFLCSQIQESAYGSWRHHLRGAKAILNTIRNTTFNHDDFGHYNITVVDIYGTAMAPVTMLSEETISQHLLYRKLVNSFKVDSLSTLTPIPTELVVATIDINIFRATAVIQEEPPSKHNRENVLPTTSILSNLQEFDSYHWADTLPSKHKGYAQSWALLATCYREATILYLFQSHSANAQRQIHESSVDIRHHALQILYAAITDLFGQRLQGGTHYKFVLWPMVICGIELIAEGQQQKLHVLCDALENMTLDLGTFAMREAATFLSSLWSDYETMRHTFNYAAIDWDEAFKRAPIFLM